MQKIILLTTILLIASNSSGAEPERLQGHYYWGHEVEVFVPCESKQSFWVVGELSLLQPLRKKTDALRVSRGQPYQPIYTEVSAISEGKADDGFASDHAGVYRFLSVHIAQEESPKGCAVNS